MSRLDIARIRAKCRVDGDCLLWTGKAHQRTGAPAGTEWVDGKDCYVGVRRRAYEEYRGVKLTDDQQVTTTCGDPACLAKKHLEAISVSEKNRRTHARMDVATKLRRGKRLSDAARRNGKVPPEHVSAIRESDEGPYIVARRLGVNGVVASRIKRGEAYREYAANPFTGLGG